MRIISARRATRKEQAQYEEATRDDLRPEYDLTQLKGGVRGKYYKQAAAETNLVLLEPDVAKAFPDSGSVNRWRRW